MNFFEHQDRAKAKTSRLVWLFVLTVLLLTGLIYLTVAFSLVLNAEMDDSVSMWNPEVLLWVIVGNTLVIGGGCLFKMLELGGRGDKVAQMLGGRLVHPETTDPAEQRLIHVIEEMAIASGVTMPEVYVLKDHSINAFAAGSKTSEAVIGVTTGCLNLLSRDELQAVMAHEFSHILNGDMRLNIRMIALLHGILSITIIGRILLELGWYERSYSDDDENGGNIGLALLGLAFMAIGGLGLAMSQVIKAAVSRQREFLADASAVQFTRNPEGITGALKKNRRHPSR
jgi:Zn-dependent protease with chaperone function